LVASAVAPVASDPVEEEHAPNARTAPASSSPIFRALEALPRDSPVIQPPASTLGVELNRL
jgi:hypothetical protein